MKILSNHDHQNNQIINVKAHLIAGDLGSPAAGHFWYDTTNNLFKWHNGSIVVNPLARSNHSGTQLAATISDFDTQVRTNRLDQMAAPTASVSMNTQKLTGLLAGTASTDAVNLQQLQDAVAGLSWKDEVRVATTANGTLATAFANGQTVDGVVLATNDRILLKNQTTGAENGIYTVNASGAPTRATDADTAAKIAGAAVFVTNGTNAGNRYVLATSGAITLGTTSLSFSLFGGGTTYSAGSGLTLSTNTFSVVAGAGITVGADVAIDTAVVVRKFAATIGDGSATSIAVTHNLGTKDVTWSVREVSGDAHVQCDAVSTSTTVLTLSFGTAPASNSLRVVVHA